MVKSFASVLTLAMAWACAAGLVAPATAGAAGRTLTVTTIADPDNGVGSCGSGGACSLREAVNQADAESGDQIVVPAGNYTLSSTFGPLALTSDATLAGSGASGTIISGGDATQILDVTSGSVTVSGVTLTHGSSGGQGGAAIVETGASLTIASDIVSGSTAGTDGGGIEDQGTLAVQNSTITGNSSNPNSSGGGIDVENYGSGAVVLSIADSTVSGNHAKHGGGISFANSSTGTLTVAIDGTTISGNSADSITGGGGGIFDWHGASSVTVTNSTIVSNSSAAGVGGVEVHSTDTFINDTIAGNTQATSGTGQQVDIHSGGTLTMQNTIAAGSGPGTNCQNHGTFTDHGHNLDDADTCGLSAASGDLINADPKLGALQSNGGPTETMALLAGSPAINAGSNTGCPATDQRGVARPQQGTCDIGAYEVAPPPPSGSTAPSVTTPAVPNKFAFRKVKVRGNGLLLVPVAVHGAGKLTARATFTVRVGHHKRTFRYGTTSARATKAGTVTLKVRLRGKAAKELRKIRHARVTITVTFAPTGGTRHTERHKVTVRRSRHGKYR